MVKISKSQTLNFYYILASKDSLIFYGSVLTRFFCIFLVPRNFISRSRAVSAEEVSFSEQEPAPTRRAKSEEKKKLEEEERKKRNDALEKGNFHN